MVSEELIVPRPGCPTSHYYALLITALLDLFVAFCIYIWHEDISFTNSQTHLLCGFRLRSFLIPYHANQSFISKYLDSVCPLLR